MKPIAISDDITTCDCCGRTGLKRTVVLRNDDGSIRYHGTSCAARAIYGYSDASVNNRVKKDAITEQSYEKQRQADVARKVANACKALELLAEGNDLNHPDILSQHKIWRNCTSNPFDPNPKLPVIGFRKWLEERSVSPL